MSGWWLAALLAAAPQKPTKSAPPSKQESSFEAEMDKQLDAIWEQQRPDAGELPPFRWALKNLVDEVEMPGIIDSNGIPVKLHMVRVKGDLKSVAEDVVDNFNRQGLYIQPVVEQPQLTAETAITGLDWWRFISYTAIIRPLKKSGVCEVVLGEANIGLASAMRTMQKQVPDFVPVPPTAKNLLRGRDAELSTLSFSAGMTEDAVKKWYADEMKKLGYTETPGGFAKGDDEVRLSVRKKDGEVMVLLLKMNRR